LLLHLPPHTTQVKKAYKLIFIKQEKLNKEKAKKEKMIIKVIKKALIIKEKRRKAKKIKINK
jgi:hypothetical protein